MMHQSTQIGGDRGAISLFRNLSTAELERVKDLWHVESFAAGTNVIWMEQRGEVVYVILEGTVKIYTAHPRGREVIVAVLGPGEIVGELSVVDSLGRSASVMTMEPVRLAALDRERFWQLLRAVPALTYNLVEIVARRLRLANTQIQSLAVLDVRTRLARQLSAFAREYGEVDDDGRIRIPLRLTQGDLGDLVGASRVRVNQLIAELKRLDYLSSDADHRLTVHDLEGLERLSVRSNLAETGRPRAPANEAERARSRASLGRTHQHSTSR